MCKLTNNFQDSGGGFDKGGEIQGEGLRPPSELCFGTNRLLCFMSKTIKDNIKIQTAYKT